MRTMLAVVSLGLAAAWCGVSPCSKASPAPVAPEAFAVTASLANDLTYADGSDVTGKVVWKGDKLKSKKIKMGADAYCEAAHADPVMSEETVVSDAGDVQWAFVYVTNMDKKSDPPATAVTVKQEGCMYKPHVFGVIAGQKVLIVNGDDTNHNIHGLPNANPEFNFSQPKKGQENDKTFATPEMGMKIKCDVHPWMSAWAHVMTHPYFSVTAADGTFKISGLPAGKWKIGVWHEALEGAKEVEVEVDGKAAKGDVNFELNAKKGK